VSIFTPISTDAQYVWPCTGNLGRGVAVMSSTGSTALTLEKRIASKVLEDP
jgi:hypothetical protein